jgi:hypothetical protein
VIEIRRSPSGAPAAFAVAIAGPHGVEVSYMGADALLLSLLDRGEHGFWNAARIELHGIPRRDLFTGVIGAVYVGAALPPGLVEIKEQA